MVGPIKLVAVDIDGTWVRSDYSYDRERFDRVFTRMQAVGAHFVVASGNQYYQLRSLFADKADKLAYVAENGGLVVDGTETIFSQDIGSKVVEREVAWCASHPEVWNAICGVKSAYALRGSMSEEVFDFLHRFYPRLMWVDDATTIDDVIVKFALGVPEGEVAHYAEELARVLDPDVVPVSSGRGAIDLIVPGCHKAHGLELLAERFGLTRSQCAAFGDSSNDVEMLAWCEHGYAMANAVPEAKAAAAHVCPSNDEDGVLVVLDELF